LPKPSIVQQPARIFVVFAIFIPSIIVVVITAKIAEKNI